MSKSTKLYQEPTHEEIAARARNIYESEGCPEGKAMQHWLQAEAQLISERKAQAAKSSAKTVAAPPLQSAVNLGKSRDSAWKNSARGRQDLPHN